MFSYIKGELAEINTDHIMIDVGGIGFQIYIPSLIIHQLPSVGSQIKVHTYFQVREDAFVLYGFLNKDDLAMFRLLIGVNGIGPKGGLAILSTLSADDLRFAILSGDAKAIAKSPGVGPKTAQRVILELKDKIDFEDAFEKKLENSSADSQIPAEGTAQLRNDAVLALVALGYSQTESLKAVTKVEITDTMDVEEVLKGALKHMSLF